MDTPPPFQPKADEMKLDADRALESVVALRAQIPDDAFTAPVLGTERSGSAVVIDETGLALTIGYLITEAESVWLTTRDRRTVPAHPVLYDQETGFGLVQSLGPLDLPPLEIGSSARARGGEAAILASGDQTFTRTRIVAKQEFAGYWEYLLDEAFFVAPAHAAWSGAGLVDSGGRLIGIGSLALQQTSERGRRDLNMVVPIDLLAPLLADLKAHGRLTRPARPWLGLYALDNANHVAVADLAPGGPAEKAGFQKGDVIIAVRDVAIDGLAEFYRQLWRAGPAGVELPIEIVRDKRSMWLRAKTADRNSFLKKPRAN